MFCAALPYMVSGDGCLHCLSASDSFLLWFCVWHILSKWSPFSVMKARCPRCSVRMEQLIFKCWNKVQLVLVSNFKCFIQIDGKTVLCNSVNSACEEQSIEPACKKGVLCVDYFIFTMQHYIAKRSWKPLTLTCIAII